MVDRAARKRTAKEIDKLCKLWKKERPEISAYTDDQIRDVVTNDLLKRAFKRLEQIESFKSVSEIDRDGSGQKRTAPETLKP